MPVYRPPIPDLPVSTPWRKPGKMWAAGYHTGLDVAAPTGTPVHAVAEGDVRSVARGRIYGAQLTGPYGRYVIINDDVDGSDWAYCHLSKVAVREGQHVEAGQLIGYVGATGNVTGPHLHLERRPRMGRYGSDRNPLAWATAAPAKAPMSVHNPLTNDELLVVLKAEGCRVLETPGWRTHNRNHKGAWGRINGIMVHHTGSDSQDYGYIVSGDSSLPGPLCHFGIRMDGTVVLVSNGRANHAGGGDPLVLDRVIREDQSLMSTEAKPTRGNRNGVDGNAHFYGLEVMYDGGQAMAAAQEDATVRVCAAIARAYGWTAASVIGHREWSSDKWDPGQEPMVEMRRKIKARIESTPKTVAASTTKPASAGEQDWSDMATKQEIQDAVRTVVRQELAKPMAGPWAATFGGKTVAMEKIRHVIREEIAAALAKLGGK